ncbi:MAG: PhoH family protein [Atopobiaceae bacterium]|nr:PhoH family protein [Atopobiaceae bacterium]
MEPTQIRLTIPDSVDLALVMGVSDNLLRRIEQATKASITVRGNNVTILGEPAEVNALTSVFSRLIRLVEQGDIPTELDVDLLLEQSERGIQLQSAPTDDILLTHRGRAIRPKTTGQRRYIEAIRNNTVTFAVGPAGSGKTYLAMAMAVAALKRRDVGRIVLARPVVEAGESLGYLPGTMAEKLDPYVRPLYDALFDMTDMERGNTLIEQGVIEIAPLAFMRGRSFNDAFVILDEAQNTSPEQMKMFLTRLGFGSTFVVTGDISQRDLPGESGIESARRVLSGVDDISFVDLDRSDIVRHSLVARIVDAYVRDEQNKGAEAHA